MVDMMIFAMTSVLTIMMACDIQMSCCHRYWRLNPAKVTSTANSWDTSVSAASDEYKHRMVLANIMKLRFI